MRKLIKIKKDNSFVYNNTISEYLNPEIIYLPINNLRPKVNENNHVLKNLLILESDKYNVYSPVSGRVLDKKIMNVNNKEITCLKIENDYKEEEKENKYKCDFSYDNIVNKLTEYGFIEVNKLKSKKVSHLIICGFDDEPYICNNSYLLNEYSKEILEFSDLLCDTFNINFTNIAIKSSDTKNAEHYLSKIGTYPNILLSLVEDKYLLGKAYFLIKELGFNEEECLVIDSKRFINMYNAVKFDSKIVDTYVTICGPSVKRNKVIKVKIGTSFKDVIESEIKLNNEDNLYILNGLMSGFECNIENTIIDENTIGLVIIPKVEEKTLPCSSCGLCYKVCPVKVNPKKAMDKNKKSNKCLDCGLCSYICPSHINLREFLRGNHE